MKNFSRADRVCEQIRRDLADIIRGELKDPRIGMISLTAVELTPDYAHAKVYFTTLDISHLPEIQAGLRRASGFMRRELGRRVRIHTLPELHFVHDDSLERGASLSKLIDEAAALSRGSEEDGAAEAGEQPPEAGK
ncbi:30S ribosome-binding factor RbfA [Azovibrio restrictus]|uniref:30S ribosome-binding factor RbfA n=1 Tax=Azovibrio restrictus TaxID=146938 RepID=UPI0026ED3B96|nr:30S ribosome-binding factor RbfA [Azovibrio restrictus]MCE1172960.1 30S ribosome-binding factor RbfA [Azovibrio sp.]MDD3483564.1 30S ribosome-binding factor RbfA [Azovibrio restrictus]